MPTLAIAAAAALIVLGVVGLALSRVLKKRSLLQKAQKRLEWGDARGAAKLYEDGGLLEQAIPHYLAGGDRLQAITLQLKLEKLDDAVEALKGARPAELEKAAALLAEANALDGKRASAVAALAREAGLFALAAPLFEKVNDVAQLKACRLEEARALAAGGKHPLAADLFERFGELKLAALSLMEAARKEPAPPLKKGYADRAAKLLEHLGDLPAAAQAMAAGGDVKGGVELLLGAKNVGAAAQLLQWHHQHGQAAELLEKSGDLKGAAKAWATAGDMRRAAALLEKAGDTTAAARVLLDLKDVHGAAQVHLRAGSPQAAAELLAGAGDVDNAVKVHLKFNDVDAAVELLCKHGRQQVAAQLLKQRGDHHRAAVLLAESGDLLHKAQLLEGKGDYEGAAQAYLDLGQPVEAKECLGYAQKLSPGGQFLLARASMATSDHEEARKAFTALLENPGSIKRIDVLYGLARALEALDRVREAVTSLEEIVSVDAKYRDAAFRIKLLRARIAEEDAKKPVTPPPAAAANIVNPNAAPAVALPSEWGGGQVESAVDSLNDWAAQNMAAAPPVPAAPVVQNPVPALDAQAMLAAALPTAPPPSQRTQTGPREDTSSRRTGVPSRYVVEKELGRGGMGVVYRAMDANLGRMVAIKVLEGTAGTDPRVREYFLREARAIAQFNHPNIVTLFDAGLEGNQPYLVMELVEGADLRTHLDAGPLPLQQSLRILAGVAAALDYAHGRKIVHRDVKPENVLIKNEDGEPKLMDFGVATVVKEQGPSGRQATIIGTPAYMAPEQIKGENMGGWTDLYALGVVLFELVTNQKPFPDAALYHHVSTPAPDPRTLVPTLAPEIAQLVLACMAKDPKQRPASGKVVAEQLTAIAQRVKAA